MISIIYVGPFDEVYVPDIGQVVRRHGLVEVSKEVAGSEPGIGGGLGHGLLAQVENWVLPAAGNTPPSQPINPEGEEH